MNIQEMTDKIIGLSLAEDGEDITSNAIFSAGDRLSGTIMAKGTGIIAGLEVARMVFERVNPCIECVFYIKEGALVEPGVKIATVTGPSRDVLKAERVALNFMQRMSGIATITDRYVNEVKGTQAVILDTRKTSPGSRVLDKSAVRTGGASNHRMGLFDTALIKDNHIDNAGSVEKAVNKVRQAYPEIPIIVEARTMDDVKKLIVLRVDRIMLDNFSIEDMKAAVNMVGSRIPLEASGGINLKTVRKVALTGVDYISVGEITHSVRALDISLIIEEAP